MGIIRGGLFVIISVLLFTFMIISSLFLNFSLSLEYENLQEGITNIVYNLTQEGTLADQLNQQVINAAKVYCEVTQNSDLVIEQWGQEISVSCESINLGLEEIVAEFTSNLLEEVYYKEYDCDFIDCFEELGNPLFLVSEKTKDFLHEKYQQTLIISLILLIPSFLLIQKKRDFPIVLGILIILASMPLIGLKKLLSLLPENVVTEVSSIFFIQTNSIVIRMVIIGVVLILFGIVFKMFGLGFKIRNLIEKIRNSKKDHREKEGKSEANEKNETSKEESKKEDSVEIKSTSKKSGSNKK